MLLDLEAVLAGGHEDAEPAAPSSRILRKAIAFEELRDWFAAYLAPIPQNPWPPH